MPIYLFILVLIAFNERFKPISIEDLSLSFVCRCQLTGLVWTACADFTRNRTKNDNSIYSIYLKCVVYKYHTIPYHPQMYAKYEINVTYILFTIYIVWQLYDTQNPNEYNAFFITQWTNWNYLSLLNVNSICSTQLDFGSSMAFQMNFSLYLVLKLMSLSSAMIAKKSKKLLKHKVYIGVKKFSIGSLVRIGRIEMIGTVREKGNI